MFYRLSPTSKWRLSNFSPTAVPGSEPRAKVERTQSEGTIFEKNDRLGGNPNQEKTASQGTVAL